MIGPVEILVFLAVLGVLVFVHELGHFVAAKACGIYVDRFSPGMPPRIFGFKYGETDYCLGLLPIGGYVKMAGQEDAPLTEEERESTYGNIPPERWFNNKPIWQRAIVLLAGPGMNFVLAFAIYALMGGYGHEVPFHAEDTRVGMVQEDSPASAAPMYLATDGEPVDFSQEPDATGWLPGDRIVSIDAKEMTRFQDIQIAAVLGSGEERLVEIKRTGADGEVLRYLSPTEPIIMDEDLKAARFGIAPFQVALIRHILPESPAQANGLLAGDVIVSADGATVDQATFSRMVQKLPPGSIIALEVERDETVINITLLTRNQGRFLKIGFDPPLNAMIGIGDENPAEVQLEDAELLSAMDLAKGDRVLTINGDEQVGSLLRSLHRSGETGLLELQVERGRPFFARFGEPTVDTISLDVRQTILALTGVDDTKEPEIAGISDELAKATGLKRRDVLIEIDGQPATVALLEELEDTRAGETVPIKVRRPRLALGAVQKEEEFEAELSVDSVQQIGVVWGTKMVTRREKVGDIIPFAYSETVRQVTQIGSILARLFTGKLSPSMLGGPVMIGDVVTTAFTLGFFTLLEIMAIISVNLAVFNLLPLPVLDGGQLMFLVIEKIRRRPVSTRVVETVQQFGFFLIIGLLLYVTFNDVTRIFDRWRP